MSLKEINIARDNLMKSLGNKSKQYHQLMKSWFQMKNTKEEFDLQARKLLDPSQIHLHNEFLLHLCLTCSKQHLPATSLPSTHRTKFKREAQKHSNGFQAADVHEYVQTRVTHKPHPESNQYFAQDRLLPDSELIQMRLMVAAWELGLEGAESRAAQLLVVAVQHFLKNIIQAIFSRRSGFCVREDKIQYGIGIPVPNPWLRNTVGLLGGKGYGSKSVLDASNVKENVLIHTLGGKETQQDIALTYAASVQPSHKPYVTVADCFEALQIYRNAVKSNGVYSINMERIAAGMHHPSWEHMED